MAKLVVPILMVLELLGCGDVEKIRTLTWQIQPSGTLNDLQDITFIDSTKGFIVGNGGTLLRTTDGGKQWGFGASGRTEDLNAVTFANTSTGVIVGSPRLGSQPSWTLLRTTDGGESWSALPDIGLPVQLEAGIFPMLGFGWIAGNGVILRSGDDGATWTVQASGLEWIRSIAFSEGFKGWAVGGKYLYRTDDGVQWSIAFENLTPLYAVAFASSKVGFMVGELGTILQTKDGGLTYRFIDSETSETLFDLFFLDSQHGWIVGSQGVLLTTSDGGETWEAQYLADRTLSAVAFTDLEHGWIVGQGGLILTTIRF